MRKFRDLTEAKDTIVFAFGRFNPPTTGHEKLIQKVASVAGSNPYRIYPSFTQNPKKDPLPHSVKTAYMRKMFRKYAKNIIVDKDAKTAIMIAEKLYKEGYKNLIMVAGSDRVKEFSTLLNRYNDAPDQKGNQLFKFDTVNVVSAGERDPDSEGVEGMSASKMRAAASDGDVDSFLQGVPSGFADGKKLYRDVRKHMGIREDRYMGDMTDFETLRDAYLTGQIWNVGDVVEANGLVGEVVRKGTNYLSFMTEDGKVHKAWLHEINEGVKDLPPHLQKLVKQLEKKEKELEKKGLRVKTFVYNPDTGKPDIEINEIRSSRPRAGGPAYIEKNMKKHFELMKKYMKQGMSKEEASKKAYKEIVKEEVELDELWFDTVKAKLDQITHPKGYGKMVQDYAELLKQDKFKKRPNMAADEVARNHRIRTREFIKYINTLVAKKVLPQELKAEYEGEDNMFTFKEFVDEIQEDKNDWKKVSTELMGGPKHPLKSIETHAKEAGINPDLLKHTLSRETGTKHFEPKDAVKKGNVKVEKGDVVLGDTELKDKAHGIGQIRKPALDRLNKKYKTKTTVKDLQDREVNIATAAKYLKTVRKDTGNPDKDDFNARLRYRGAAPGAAAAAAEKRAWDLKFNPPTPKSKPKKKPKETPAEKEKRLFPAGRGGRIGDQPSAADIVKAQKPTKAEKPFKDVPNPRPKPKPTMNPPTPRHKPKKEEFGVNEDQVVSRKKAETGPDAGVRTTKYASGKTTKSGSFGKKTYSPTGQQIKYKTPTIGGYSRTEIPDPKQGPGPRGKRVSQRFQGKLRGSNVDVTVGHDGKVRKAVVQKGKVKVSATPQRVRVKAGMARPRPPKGKKFSPGAMGGARTVPLDVTRNIKREDMTFKDFVNQIQERELTNTEVNRKEEIVKSMKKKMPEFKKNYGKDAKSVMYATATKIAKNES